MKARVKVSVKGMVKVNRVESSEGAACVKRRVSVVYGVASRYAGSHGIPAAV
jgi:hypothetical protein